MSGTSLDGVDAVIATHSPESNYPWMVEHHLSIQLPAKLKEILYQLNFPDTGEYGRYHRGELDAAKIAEQQITQCYAQAYQQLIISAGIDPEKVVVIGAHGQTIRHEPQSDFPYTIQLLNGALLSHLTNQTVVCDFRSKDIAAGGQGAPLAPIFHHQLFPYEPGSFAVVNIGGIANISIIDNSVTPTLIMGFDCGAGNCLMDEWILKHHNRAFDSDGQWARQGKILSELLSRVMADDYFHLPIPKSTGRDYFHSKWLLGFLGGDEAPVDVMRTLLQVTATGIVDGLPAGLEKLIIVGGGAKNTFLCQTITNMVQQRGGGMVVEYGSAVAIDAQHVEALGFALLAKSCIEGRALPTNAITGAKESVVCGAIYQKNRPL